MVRAGVMILRFQVCLWLTYDSTRRADVAWRSEIVHLSEPDRTHIIQSFVYKGLYYFVKASKGTVSFFVWSGSESVSLT